MTVAELIIALGAFPAGAPVITQGEHGDCAPQLAGPALDSYLFNDHGEPVCAAGPGDKDAVVVVIL